MKKRYYTAESLEGELRAYEARYAIPTPAFYAIYRSDETPETIDDFDAMVWADAWRELQRLRAGTQRDLVPSSS